MTIQLEDLVAKLRLDDKDFASKMRNAGAGLVAIGTPFAAAATGAFNLAAQLEQDTVAFEVMLGSAEAAQSMLGDLSEFAAKTPFELVGIRDTARQLLAMGVETENLLPTMKSLGDVAAGVNQPIERIALNFGQVMTQGKLTGRELRDFTTMGIPLVDELANQLGVAKDEIADMVSAGEITSDIIVQAFENMSSEGGKFANLMDEQSKTVAGRISNLKDTVTQLGESIGQFLLPIVGEWIDKFSVIVEKFSELDDSQKEVIAKVLLFGAALVPLGGLLIILPSLIAGVTAALGLLFSPIGLIIAAIALLTAAWMNNWGGIRDIVTSVWENVLQPIITGIVSFYNENLKPVLDAWAAWFKETLPIALEFLRGIWEGVLLPSIQRGQKFFKDHLLPLFISIANFVKTVFSLAFTVLGGIWTNVVLPAITKVWEFLRDKALPIFVKFSDWIREKIEPALQALGGLFDWVKGLIDKFSTALSNIKDNLPDWLTPGSPTPLELGLRGINSEIKSLNSSTLPEFSSNIAMQGVSPRQEQSFENSRDNIDYNRLARVISRELAAVID